MQAVQPIANVGKGRKRKAAPLTHPTMGLAGMMGAPTEEISDCDEEDNQSIASAAGSQSQRMPKIRVGNRNLTMHSELIEMTDSTDLFKAGQFDALRQRLETDGFLFLRGVIPRETVEKARHKMLKHLHSKGAIRHGTEWKEALIEYQSVWDENNKTSQKSKKAKTAASTSSSLSSSSSSKKMIPGWTVDAESGGIIGGREPDSAVKGWHAIGNSKELTDVYNGAALKSLYQSLFSQSTQYSSRPELAEAGLPAYSTLPSCTWLRAKGPGEVTAEHADYYYFAKNTHIFRDYWREEKDANVDSSPLPESIEDRETCQICHDPRDPDRTLICDLCEHGYHTDCLTPRLTNLPTEEQEFHCYKCQNKPMNYWTCWTALGDIGGHDGRLALVAGSHRLSGYEAPVRDDLLPKEYTKSFESHSIWQTPTRIDMGDIILFNIKTIHAATKNAGERFRLSLDTRVTTCFGAEYCAANGIGSIEEVCQRKSNKENDQQESSQAEAAIKLKSSQTKAKDPAGKVTAYFQAKKKDFIKAAY